MVESEAEFEVRIFLVPDPGAFVNLVDKIEMDDIESAADGDYVDRLGDDVHE